MKLLKTLKKGDFVIFAIILIIAIICLVPFISTQTDQLVCEISQDNKIIHKIILNKGYKDKITIETQNGNSVICIEDNSVWFESSDCPDQVCVHTGKLTHAGQIAVCLPNKVIIKLIGQENQIDAIAT